MAETVVLGVLVLILGMYRPGGEAGATGSEPDPRGDATRDASPAASRAVDNGPLFVVWWEDYCEVSCYSVWRGGPTAPFRRLNVEPEGAPCVSPDGSQLAYASRRRTIVVRRILPLSDELGPPEVIARLPRGETGKPDCAWSPHGHSLIFVGAGGRNEASVWRLRRNGTELLKLGEVPAAVAGYPTDPAWSSTGRVAFRSGLDRAWLAMMDADGTDMRRLGHRGHSPTWSPDGRQFAFIDSAGEEYEQIWPGPVMVADANGEDVRRLRRGENGAVAFSPDGRRLAFARSVTRSGASDRVEITRTDGTTIRTLPVEHQSIFPIRLTWTSSAQR
jgi:Tol biopolymer transport system component